MQVRHFHLQKTEEAPPCVLALGLFDGVHVGHRALLDEAKTRARAQGLAFSVFTFDSACGKLKAGAKRLYPTKQKLALLEEIGADIVFLADFAELSDLSPEDFLDRCVIGQMNARVGVFGYNFRFGKGAEGTPEFFADRFRAAGLSTVMLPEVFLDDGSEVSTTKIREALARGDLPTANRLLGAPYTQFGTVCHGKGLGHLYGIPTVNTKIEDSYDILSHGVYLTAVSFDGARYRALTNVGVCPTFGAREVHAETSLYDFDGDLYGKEVRIEYYRKLREERRFDNEDALVRQINADLAYAKGVPLPWKEPGQN